MIDSLRDFVMMMAVFREFDGKAAEEPMNESQRLITAIDSNLKDTISRQRHRNSAVLLRKELEKDRTDSPAEFHVKVFSSLFANSVFVSCKCHRIFVFHNERLSLVIC